MSGARGCFNCGGCAWCFLCRCRFFLLPLPHPRWVATRQGSGLRSHDPSFHRLALTPSSLNFFFLPSSFERGATWLAWLALLLVILDVHCPRSNSKYINAHLGTLIVVPPPLLPRRTGTITLIHDHHLGWISAFYLHTLWLCSRL